MSLQTTKNASVTDAPDAVRDLCGMGASTQIATLDGVLPIEYLCPGDRIVTRQHGRAVLRALHVTREVRDLVRIPAGVLGRGLPERDMLLPPRQRLLIRQPDLAQQLGIAPGTVQAATLVGKLAIHTLPPRAVRLWHPLFETPQIIYADGLELATTAPSAAAA